MPEKYVPKTDKEKLEYLIATDERRDNHVRLLQTDIKVLTENVDALVTVIVGSKFNKKTGFVDLVNVLESKVDILKTDMADLKKDIDHVKYWGRGATGFLFALCIVIVNYVKDKF